jgi:hypothetical protein
MYDPALGPTRQMRAFGEMTNPDGTKKIIKNRNNNTRMRATGMYSGRRGGYMQYNVSEQAQDILKRRGA